jgi:membrane-associated protease RseP (regulator of RpoE activity)
MRLAKNSFFCLLSLGIGAGLLAEPGRVSAATPQEILAQAKAASGAAAWDTLRSSHTVFRVETSGLTGTAEGWDDVLSGRGLVRFALGPVTGAEGYDGKILWSQDASGQTQKNEVGEEYLRGMNDAYRRCLGYWYPERWPAEMVYEGEQAEAGRRFQVVTVTPRPGRPFAIWIDAETRLFDRTVEQAAGEINTTFFSDYRDVHGVKLPYALRTTNGEAQYDQFTNLQGVEWNAGTSDDLFAMPGPPAADYAFAEGKTATTIPFQLINNHIYVDVRLNGKGPFRFLCDTGGMNVLTPTLAGELGLEAEGALQGRGVGEKSEDVGLVTLDSLSVGEVTLRKQAFIVFALEPFGDIEGVPQSGLIGYEVFKRFVVGIDYEKSLLTLAEPSAFTYSGGGTAVPFQFDGQTPQVDGSIDGIPGAFSIDTGGRASLTLLAPFVEKHELRKRPGPKIEAVTGWGLGGPARGMVTRMKGLRLGSVDVGDFVVDLSLQTKGAFTDPYVAGNVGGGVLRRFNLVFDYGNQTIVFEPNARFGDPDLYDRSGMWVNRKGAEIVIVDVTAGGPAEAAGLKNGDRILAVDGRPVADVSLVDLRERFRTEPPGTEIHLRVKRGDAENEVVLVLKDQV